MNKTWMIGRVTLLLACIAIFVVLFFPSHKTHAGADEAINTVITMHPELAAYRTTSLPPSSIETKDAPDGWYVGFIQSGSGVPGILNAKCYHVTAAGGVTLVGAYPGGSGKIVERIALATCAPVFAE